MRAKLAGLVAFALSAALTVVLFLNALEAERNNTRLEFGQAAAIRINALRTEVQTTLEVLALVSRHLELVRGGTLKGFQHYVAPMLAQHPYLQAVGYNPQVSGIERAAFERKARDEYPDFRISESTGQGKFVNAIERDTFYPFLYAEPVTQNRAAIGFDVAMETRPNPRFPRRVAINKAVESSIIAVTEPISLVLSKSTGQTGVIAFSPLYRDDIRGQARLFGFATLVIRVGDMLLWSQRMAEERGWKQVALSLQDVSEPVPFEMYSAADKSRSPLSHEEFIDVPGNRKWRVVATPHAGSFSLAPGRGELTLLGSGIALSAMLGVLAYTIVGQSDSIRRQVRERTVELAQANGQLQDEIKLRRDSENRLRQVMTLQKAVLSNAGYAIIATDREGTIRVFNTAAEKMLEYSSAEVIGQMLPSVFHDREHLPDNDGTRFKTIVSPLDSVGSDQSVEQEVTYWTKSGKGIPVMLSISSMIDETGERVGYIGIAHDISMHKAAQARINHLALYDALTDLPNRVLLLRELHQAIQNAKRFECHVGVLFVDLDRFKNINDSLGHHVGDALLKEVADRLRSCLRGGDLVARMGGDEFVVVITSMERLQDSCDVAARILASVSAPIQIKGHNFVVTPSIGIAAYPDDGTDSGTLIQHADTAMYSAKELGRNNYQFFTRNMNQLVSERLRTETLIREALRDSRLVLHYQPQFDLRTRQLIGAEALVRITENGVLIPPGQFISVAEESGLILEVGNWVLEEAARQSQTWIQQGLNVVPLAINVSARQFEQPGFAESIQALLEKTGLAANLLEIELTESVVMKFAEKAENALWALKKIGLRIAIDDFGTGFSSLSYLNRFPIDRLKVDRSFVVGLESGTEQNSIVPAIISLAHQLKMEVVAEGVETDRQADLLLGWDCDVIQGYLLGRPLTAHEMEKRLPSGRAFDPLI